MVDERAGDRGQTTSLPAIVAGEGPPLLLLHGFGLGPTTYQRSIELAARRARVVAPHWLRVSGRWTADKALRALLGTLDHLGIARASLVTHSAGGGLALRLLARHPDRIREAVFTDTIGLSMKLPMVYDFSTGANLLKLATWPATRDFLRTVMGRPLALTTAGFWAFFSDMEDDIQAARENESRIFVLWAERDTLLPRDHGEEFAAQLAAPFILVRDVEEDGPVDHDWVFRHPRVFDRILRELGVPSG